MDFKKTPKQVEAIDLLAGSAKHIALYGGSRSGKTFILIYALIVRAIKCPDSRHVILRKTFNSVKKAVWMDTLPKVFKLAFPDVKAVPNKSDYYYKFSNGSEIWIGGMEDNERLEKILGMEYSTIYYNECSQIQYYQLGLVTTRLAQKNALRNRFYYDFNPPTKKHWSYPVFIQGLDPVEREPLKNPDSYAHMILNPVDNLDNLDDEYLDMLEALPEKERDRFLKGLFTDDSDGIAYYSFNREEHVRDCVRQAGTVMIGMDFNVNPMTAVIGQYRDSKFYIFDEAFLENSDTYKMCDHLIKKDFCGLVYPDSTGKNRKTSGISDFSILKSQGFTLQKTLNPFVVDRVNNLNRLFQEGRIIIDPRCKKLINDLESVAWKDNKLDQKSNPMLTHISDALGYWTWSIDPLMDIAKTRTYRYA